jgi:hypothetical protein
MQSMFYIGLDVHKKTISYCVKDGSGQIHATRLMTSIEPSVRQRPGSERKASSIALCVPFRSAMW